jgi:hypothetical protein
MNNWKDEISRREHEAEMRHRKQVTEVATILGFIGVMMVFVGISWIYLR